MTPEARARWTRVGRGAMVVFLVLVAALLVRYARAINWDRVLASLADYRASELLTAAALAATSYLFYCSYDLAARRYTQHGLRTPRVMAVAFVSYVMSLNLGALIGGGGFRLRLYSHAGLTPSRIVRVAAFSIFTNWLGYAVLAGVILLTGVLQIPPDWPIPPWLLRTVGGALVSFAFAYWVACALFHGRHLRLRGRVFHLPTLRMALLQTALACGNWSVIAGIIHVLMDGRIAYAEVLGVLLLSGIAAALVHVPAGIGVLEAVFIAMLDSQMPRFEILAALLAYRAVYYLAPLLLALPMYFSLEAHHRIRGPRVAAPDTPG
ncbi:lysylphosphatidylglycerol synthase domain-containing protein [Cognatilysobacter bugurensis]|uniref:Membrane protein n=1 Tax=Cognatilysobacter bugurensis TaxID=543356 RepID=A0A918SU25_9GAMM|nr:lysylphosphatidylglycerol synthase domain-containing protein [Lysobacter bugurensis]GHA71247.1 membrane protein [Lysobacter bugurensis]